MIKLFTLLAGLTVTTSQKQTLYKNVLTECKMVTGDRNCNKTAQTIVECTLFTHKVGQLRGPFPVTFHDVGYLPDVYWNCLDSEFKRKGLK